MIVPQTLLKEADPKIIDTALIPTTEKGTDFFKLLEFQAFFFFFTFCSYRACNVPKSFSGRSGRACYQKIRRARILGGSGEQLSSGLRLHQR